jgi:hypothetical protein
VTECRVQDAVTYVGRMPDWSTVGRQHVLAALAEHDRLGEKEFLRRYGFRRARSYVLWHDGREYSSKAVLGAAYLQATGRPATWDEFSGGEEGAAKVLRTLRFDVIAEEEPVPSARKRSTSAPKPRAKKKVEAPLKVCPTCHVALPATGVCDYCD